MDALEITLNEKPLELAIVDETPLESVLETIQVHHVTSDEVVSSIYIDGTYWGRERDAELKQIRAKDVRSIAVVTETPDKIASQGLQDLQVITGMIHEHMRGAAETIRLGRLGEGLLLFLQGADMLRDALHFVRLFLGHNQYEESHEAHGRLQDIHEGITESLKKFELAQQADDWNLISDIIDYEITPCVALLASLTDLLCKSEVAE